MKQAVLRPASHRKRLLAAGTVLAVLALGLMGLAAPAMASTSCSVTWTGNAGNGLWSTASNWSTDRVPGPTSDVCIPTLTTANATPPISVHSIQVGEGASLLFGSGSVSIATSLTNQGFITLTGTALSAASITLPSPGNITTYGNSSITSPAFSNTSTVSVGAGTLRLADDPVQLQNGTLSGGSWLVSGVLVVPRDISQVTTQGTVVSIDGTGSAVQDASGNNALATLTTVGPGVALAIDEGASLTVAQGLTSHGVVDVGTGSAGSLTVSGGYTQASGATTNMSVGTLTATSVSVQPGSTLQGNGTVTSSVTNNGNVAPQGSLTVTGNYSQTASAALTEQFGSTLNVTSNATLSGALNVTVNPKHPPQPGAVYTALTFGSLNGSFTSHTAGYTLTTNANNIKVTKQ
jgi:fibronectin-binding autotransporter adhesin